MKPDGTERWDEVWDVVVAGYGGAGACAAIAAHDAGARVLVLEKAPFGGGNTGCSLGAMRLPNNVDDGIKYYRALSFGTVADEELIRAFAEAMICVPEMLRSWGVELKLLQKNTPTFPTLPGAGCIDHWYTGPGAKAFQSLERNIAERKIEVRYEAPVRKLVQDPASRAVLGVVAAATASEKRIKAARGVVLATGGYENDAEMVGYYHYPGIRLYPFGTPYNTGDGVRMALAAGADQWHFVCTELLGFAIKAPSDEHGVAFGFMDLAGSFVYVNQSGRRFMNEAKRLTHRKDPIEAAAFDHERATYPNLPAFCVFDEKHRAKGPLYRLRNTAIGYASWRGLDEWSGDNRAEIEKGWIAQADSLPELARKLRIEPDGLAETVSQYNTSCAAGGETGFGRPADSSKAIDTPPYYAFEVCLALVNTQGGPKHNRWAQALDTEGKPIPRLYTPGELGSFFGHLYQGGTNYPEALAFGRIAGEKAAAETPW